MSYFVKNKPMKFNIAVIYGSVRTNRQGIKGALFLVEQLKKRGHDVTLIDTQEADLPMLDKMYKEYDKGTAPESLEKVATQLNHADGFVVVSGEYNHSITPALKNLLDHYQGEYLFKPSAIATYSAGPFGGARASVHLRAIVGELGMPSIPSMFAMSAVQKSFDEEGNAIDEAYNRRVKRFLEEFEWYLAAFYNQRQQGTPQ